MRVLLLYAHPVETSFHAALRGRIVESLHGAGHQVAVSDLYREGFQPCLTRAERIVYDADADRSAVAEHVERLRWAEALVFCFPTWWYGPPAILKGYLDRVWVPGVAFHLPPGGGAIRPGLTHVRRLVVVTTYGGPWWYVRLAVGDPGRRMLTRGLRPLLAPTARTAYLAHYAMDRSTEASRARFLDRVGRRLRKL